MKVFVVVPAYHEAEAIGKVVDSLCEYTEHIVVVDDGSSDATEERAREHGVCVLKHVVNRGQGAALQTGNAYALMQGADVIVHFDADGQHQAKDIPVMIAPLLSGEADVVLGSRFLSGSVTHIPFTKRLFLLPLARFVNFVFTGLYLTDGHNGWRAMSRRAAELLTIEQDRMAHNTEISSLIRKHHMRHKEVPVDIVYHEYGQGFFDGIRILWELVKSRFVG